MLIGSLAVCSDNFRWNFLVVVHCLRFFLARFFFLFLNFCNNSLFFTLSPRRHVVCCRSFDVRVVTVKPRKTVSVYESGQAFQASPAQGTDVWLFMASYELRHETATYFIYQRARREG